MNTQITDLIEQEINRLQAAKNVLSSTTPTSIASVPTTSGPPRIPAPVKEHGMSAEGRASVAKAQKKRWRKIRADRKAAAMAQANPIEHNEHQQAA